MKRKQKKNNQEGAPRWMVTYSDLMSLILVFFILLFSMSQIDAQKFRAISESFQSRHIFDFLPSSIEFIDLEQDEGENQDNVNNTEGEVGKPSSSKGEMDELLQDVLQYLEQAELKDMISATRDDRGVVLVLQERLLFETGEAVILPEARPFLDKVGTLLKAIPNMVKVEGHTDSRPISTYRYPSNWELSGARASSVIRYLITNHSLDPKRFIAVGYGDTRPVVPNTTVENLQQNRRVVIVISDPAYDDGNTF